jgi:hypothetical protein
MTSLVVIVFGVMKIIGKAVVEQPYLQRILQEISLWPLTSFFVRVKSKQIRHNLLSNDHFFSPEKRSATAMKTIET